MKRLLSLALIGLVSVSSGFAQDEKTETKQAPWFDMENCEICKSMAHSKDMMQKVKWETYLIPNGFLAVSVVPDKMKAPMASAKKEMKATIARMEKGEDIECCGYCRAMAELMEAGAELRELSTIGGEITMLTSTDADVVDKIHAHGKRTIAEHKKMKKNMMKQHDQSSDHQGGHQRAK